MPKTAHLDKSISIVIEYDYEQKHSGYQKHGDFTRWPTRTLIKSLWKEFRELNSALIDGNSEHAENECIDVANLAYMVAYSLRKRGVKGR